MDIYSKKSIQYMASGHVFVTDIVINPCEWSGLGNMESHYLKLIQSIIDPKVYTLYYKNLYHKQNLVYLKDHFI